ncbi:uncharacterized protein [Watersipora subatra]|uniref:uncharacterized protein n=1 Tax=Watersipora subatra TaxID=2589382 RepID=UPI00355B152B
MACCRKKNKKLVNQLSFEENELDVMSGTSVAPTESSKGDEELSDPDSLSAFQVISSIFFLILFAACFATSFSFFTAATNSLQSNFANQTYSCKLASISEKEITCLGTTNISQCINIMLACEGLENQTLLLYEFYHDYFSSVKCSTTRCSLPDKIIINEKTKQEEKSCLELVKNCCTDDSPWITKMYPAKMSEDDLHAKAKSVSKDGFYYDLNKPEAIFLEKSELGTPSLVFGRNLSYTIIALPLILMVLIGILVIYLFQTFKLTANEIYRPLTPITPLHMQVNGKWYIKEVQQNVQMNAFEKLRAAKNSS